MTLMERRRALISGSKAKAKLPSGYQEVEYIQSTGTQAIISPVYLKNNSKIYAEFLYTSQQNTGGFLPTFGCARPFFSFSNANDAETITYCSFGSVSDKNVSVPRAYFRQGDFHTVVMDRNGVSFDDTYSADYSATVEENPGRKIALFCRMSANNTLERFSERKIRVFRVYESDVPVCDLVPCFRKADGEIGMYDIVSGTFLTNAGTGTFVKGENV